MNSVNHEHLYENGNGSLIQLTPGAIALGNGYDNPNLDDSDATNRPLGSDYVGTPPLSQYLLSSVSTVKVHAVKANGITSLSLLLFTFVSNDFYCANSVRGVAQWLGRRSLAGGLSLIYA